MRNFLLQFLPTVFLLACTAAHNQTNMTNDQNNTTATGAKNLSNIASSNEGNFAVAAANQNAISQSKVDPTGYEGGDRDDDAIFEKQFASAISWFAADQCPQYENLQTENEMSLPIWDYYEKYEANGRGEEILLEKLTSFAVGLGLTPNEASSWMKDGVSEEESCPLVERILKKYPFTKNHIRAV